MVSKEVRKLAERSGAAAREISTLIERCNQAVAQGARTVDATVEAMDEIQHSIAAARSVVRDIGASGEEQARISIEVTKTAADLARAAGNLAHTVA